MASKLKACPFCGIDVEQEQHKDECYFVVDRLAKARASKGYFSKDPAVYESWNRRAQPDANEEEHELIGYMDPSALVGLLAGSDTTTTISSAIPSLIQPAPTPSENWAVPIYVMRRPGEQP